MKEYRGVVKNGVVALEDGSDLPDGTKVRVQPSDEAWERFWKFLQATWEAGLKEGEQVSDDISERVGEYLAEAMFNVRGEL